MMAAMSDDSFDSIGRVRRSPRRIVSLCPSLTETLIMLGAGDRLIGRTRYCTQPAGCVEHVAIVGGVHDINQDAINRLAPDLVLASREENQREPIEALASRRPVLVADVKSVDDARRLIGDLGAVTGTMEQAQRLVNLITESFEALEPLEPPLRTVCLVWKQPLMAASGRTYIGDLLRRAGLVNTLPSGGGTYPTVTLDELATLQPDVLLLPDEPYAFGETDALEFQRSLPQTRSFLVDGQMLAWYGGRTVQAAGFLEALRSQVVPGCEALRQPG
jgi:ABC-type Fe3+-hydroxamate transport system substrate-binding protein